MRLAVTAVLSVMATAAIGHSLTWHVQVEARDIRLHTRDLMQPAMPHVSTREVDATRMADDPVQETRTARVKARSDAPSSSYGSQRSSSSSSKKAWSSVKKAMTSVAKTLSLGSKSKKAPSTGTESSAPPPAYGSFPSLRSSRSVSSGSSRSKIQKAVLGRSGSLHGYKSSFGRPIAEQRRDLTNNAEPTPMGASRPQDLRIKRDLLALLARGITQSTANRDDAVLGPRPRTSMECLHYFADRDCERKQGTLTRHPTEAHAVEEGQQVASKIAFAGQLKWPPPEPVRPEMPVVTLGSGPKRLDLVRHEPIKEKSRWLLFFGPRSH